MRKMRRGDRQTSHERALEIVDTAEYGFIASISADGTPYNVAVSHVLMNGSIYFHSALDGHKCENFKLNPRVCFACAIDTELVPSEFALNYASATVFGEISLVSDEGERTKAFIALAKKFSEGFDPADEIAKTGKACAIYKVQINEISGKQRKE